jgi:hypothetical protein
MVCYALYRAVSDKLAGSPSNVSKSKVSAVYHGYNGGRFYINWQVQGNISAARKSLGLALQQMNPAKVYPAYQDFCRLLKRPPSREVFNYVADEITKSIKSGIMCAVVGRIKADKSKVEDMLEVLNNKMPNLGVEGSKSRPEAEEACHQESCEIKCTGWPAALLKEYIISSLKGVSVNIATNGVCVNVKDTRWTTIQVKLKANIKNYMRRYNNTTDLHPILASFLLGSSSAGAFHVHKLLKEAPTVAAIESSINRCL